jgi:hypothetical protein
LPIPPAAPVTTVTFPTSSIYVMLRTESQLRVTGGVW